MKITKEQAKQMVFKARLTQAKSLTNEKRLEQALSKLFQRVKKEVLDSLREYWTDYQMRQGQIDMVCAPIHAAHREYMEILEKHIKRERSLGRAEAKRLVKLANKNRAAFKEANTIPIKGILEKDELFGTSKYAEDKLLNHTFQASEKTMQRIDKDINKIISDGYRGGKGIDSVSRDIIKRFDQIADWEARRIARTEIHNAHQNSIMQTYEEMGVEYTQWSSVNDGRTRGSRPKDKADHIVLNGEIIKFGGKYSNGLEYPGDTNGKLVEWINCRCSHAPFVMPPGKAAPPGMAQFRVEDLISIEAPDYDALIKQAIDEYNNKNGNSLVTQELGNKTLYELTPNEKIRHAELKKKYDDASVDLTTAEENEYSVLESKIALDHYHKKLHEEGGLNYSNSEMYRHLLKDVTGADLTIPQKYVLRGLQPEFILSSEQLNYLTLSQVKKYEQFSNNYIHSKASFQETNNNFHQTEMDFNRARLSKIEKYAKTLQDNGLTAYELIDYYKGVELELTSIDYNLLTGHDKAELTKTLTEITQNIGELEWKSQYVPPKPLVELMIQEYTSDSYKSIITSFKDKVAAASTPAPEPDTHFIIPDQYDTVPIGDNTYYKVGTDMDAHLGVATVTDIKNHNMKLIYGGLKELTPLQVESVLTGKDLTDYNHMKKIIKDSVEVLTSKASLHEKQKALKEIEDNLDKFKKLHKKAINNLPQDKDMITLKDISKLDVDADGDYIIDDTHWVRFNEETGNYEYKKVPLEVYDPDIHEGYIDKNEMKNFIKDNNIGIAGEKLKSTTANGEKYAVDPDGKKWVIDTRRNYEQAQDVAQSAAEPYSNEKYNAVSHWGFHGHQNISNLIYGDKDYSDWYKYQDLMKTQVNPLLNKMKKKYKLIQNPNADPRSKRRAESEYRTLRREFKEMAKEIGQNNEPELEKVLLEIMEIDEAIAETPALLQDTCFVRYGHFYEEYCEIGKVVDLDGFLSLSYDDATTMPDATAHFAVKPGRWKISVLAPEGTKGIRLNAYFGALTSEREWLLQRNQKMEVVSYDLTGDMPEVVVRLIPD